MKVKLLKKMLPLLIVLFFLGCDKNPVEPDASVEERINGNRPFNEIIVYHPEFTYVFSKYDEDAWKRISEAYAEDGYLIVITKDNFEEKTYYFNLLSAKKLETFKGKINITY